MIQDNGFTLACIASVIILICVYLFGEYVKRKGGSDGKQ